MLPLSRKAVPTFLVRFALKVSYPLISMIHIGAASIALTAGTCVVLSPKGTRWHKRFGYTYVVSMLVMIAAAFFIYRLFGHFGPFHVSAIFSLITLSLGFIPALLRKPRGSWLRFHAEIMAWSYVGLLAAAAAEMLVRIPSAPFWPVVLAAVIAIYIIGGAFIVPFRKKLLARRWFGAQPKVQANRS